MSGCRLLGIAFGVAVGACSGRDPADDYFGVPAPDLVNAQGGAAGAPGGTDPESPTHQGTFDVVDMAAAACDGVLEGTLVPDLDGERPVVVRLLSSDGKWLAESSYDSGFYRLSSDGAEVEEGPLTAGSLDRLAVVGGRALVVSTNGYGVVWSSYDEDSGLSVAAAVAPERAFELAVGGAGDVGLVTWAGQTTVHARLLDAEGPFGDVLELQAGVITDSFRAAVGPAGDGLLVAWSTRRISDSAFVSRVVSVSAEGAVGPVRTLYESPLPHQVVELAPTAGGALLLLEDDGAPLLVPLTPGGLPSGNAVRVAEGAAAYALASNGAKVLLGARLADGRDALRVMDESGQPRGAWQCLHAQSGDDEHAVALGADGESFAVFFRDEGGENRSLRFE